MNTTSGGGGGEQCSVGGIIFSGEGKLLLGRKSSRASPPMYDTLYTVYDFGKLQGIIICMIINF